jgi:uncharacterized protein CbrC (UPF0167 family)
VIFIFFTFFKTQKNWIIHMLPKFKYHPDPIATGSIKESDAECLCCKKRKGFIYSGPVYAEAELDEGLCPWCIADGSAHKTFLAQFVDQSSVGGNGEWDDVSEEVAFEVACKTPGFSGWQEERWWTHCADAAQFVGKVGKVELLKMGTQAISAIQDSTGLADEEWEGFLSVLDKNEGPTAYLFKCRHCGLYGGYQDSH